MCALFKVIRPFLQLFMSSSHSQPQHQPALTEAEDDLQSLNQQGTCHQWAQ